MVNVGDQLKKTSKGQLLYSRDLDDKSVKILLEQCSSPPTISSFHKEVTDVSIGSSFGLQEKVDENENEEKGQKEAYNEDMCKKVTDDMQVKHADMQVESNARNSKLLQERKTETICDESKSELEEQLSHLFNISLTTINELDSEWDNKARDYLREKEIQFHKNDMELKQQYEQHMEDARRRVMQKPVIKQSQFEQELNTNEGKIPQTVQKLRKSHSDCTLRQDARIKEVEELNQTLRQEMVKRQELERKIASIQKLAQEIQEVTSLLQSSIDGCQYKNHLGLDVEKSKTWADSVAKEVEILANMAGKNGDDDEILHKLKQFKDSTQNFGDLIKKAIVTAEEKGKEAEASRQLIQSAPQLAQPQKTAVEVQPTAADASHTEEKVLVEVTKEFEKRKELIVQINSKLEPFIKNKDQQMKKFRFELQKAVNTPVNAISPVSRAHLLDILKRLQTLLRGQVVHVSDKSISACSVPEGIDFCKNLVARMIARKAEEQVSSNHESAFAIATIAVGLWAEFTEVGELLMSHLQELCPYVIPYYQPRLPGQSSADYHRALGYKVDEDGTIEQQDKFLKRMSGVIRLYAAILITSPPQKVPHPHGLEYAWIWLSRALNLHPNPDITATAIYDILQVTGHALLKAYRVQFVKLLYFILKSYLPKLKDVAANSGPVSRLEIFLETTMKNSGMIALPEGYIPPEFWN